MRSVLLAGLIARVEFTVMVAVVVLFKLSVARITVVPFVEAAVKTPVEASIEPCPETMDQV